MNKEAAEFQDAVQNLEESYRQGLRAFAEWFSKEWQISREEWVKSYKEAPPSDDWFVGHNTGVESVLTALDCFLDDHQF